jgi:hypothetical protein
MATLYRTDGTTAELKPGNGVTWTLEEWYKLLSTDTVDIVSTVDGRYLVIDDYGKLRKRELNIPATRLYIHGRSDWVAGDALVVDTKLELDGAQG